MINGGESSKTGGYSGTIPGSLGKISQISVSVPGFLNAEISGSNSTSSPMHILRDPAFCPAEMVMDSAGCCWLLKTSM